MESDAKNTFNKDHHPAQVPPCPDTGDILDQSRTY